jgi:GNAT superfamily N-acetyltransferase
MITLQRTEHDDRGFTALVELLDADLTERYRSYQKNFTPLNILDTAVKVVLAIDGAMAVGCGALRPMEEAGTAEVKRMFVLPAYRGKGISKKILQELEAWAVEEHFTAMRLETGKKQPEAIALYESSGYTRTEPYGAYKNIAEAICMRKTL